eukprot:TRINITY_DN23399_c0_g1_i1.p3 TRINITY_DN23399_c0_g1~~TRINITY_DN23399_c0_g1_i1.p3  ORF type:complete len:128 (+),score=5.35 TRINITY_DN23399_c0_g1_i1:161-544(+)
MSSHSPFPRHGNKSARFTLFTHFAEFDGSLFVLDLCLRISALVGLAGLCRYALKPAATPPHPACSSERGAHDKDAGDVPTPSWPPTEELLAQLGTRGRQRRCLDRCTAVASARSQQVFRRKRQAKAL